ncbi:MAG: tryptophan synthase subunit alpha, partial [Chitinophagaceae bacterium]
MKNRIKELFEHKQGNILSIYYTAGYPGLNDTVRIAQDLQNAGADMLEIGFPYSDPVADGPVIQNSSKIALDMGMDLKTLFLQLKELRNKVQIPVLLMGYINPVLQFGVEDFCRSCKEVGIDGCIIPDLPLAEYKTNYLEIFRSNGLSNVLLITPQTSDERIRMIDELSDGFIYLLSSSATTGQILSLNDQTSGYFQRIKDMQLKNPTMIGFGINGKDAFDHACQYSNGAIIGSAFVKALANE